MGDESVESKNIKEKNAENDSNNIGLVVNEEPDSSSSNQQTWTDSNNEDQKTQTIINEKQEKINHLKELQELENSLQSELVKSRMERHKLQSEPNNLTNKLVRGELTEENMKSLEMIRRGIDNLSESENDKKEFNHNKQN